MSALFTCNDVKGYNSKLSNVSLEQIENVNKKSEILPQKRLRKKSKCKQEDSESSSLAERTSANAIDHVVKKFHQKFIILHYSPFKAVWDWIVLLLVVYTAIFTPFTVAFLLNDNEKRAKLNQHASTRLFKKQQLAGADPFVMLDLIVDLMFLIDIFINFRTTFVSKQGDVVYDPMIIAKSYFKGWFFIDALSGMPYDLLLFGSGNIDTIKFTGYLKTIRLVRLIRIFPKLQTFSEYGIAMLLLLLAVFGLVGHWLACVFYAIAYVERPTLPEPKYSWLDHLAEKYNMPFHENNSESGPDLKSKYITALFFTLTSLTSVGFGNVSPTTNWEKIFSIISMMLGSLISAAIFGNVTTIMIRMYQGTEELTEMQESVKDFIKFHTIPKSLSKRMQESFEHTWSFTNGIDMNTVLKSFPESLQADICLHLNRQLLNNCQAFQDASEGCLRMLALQFKSTHVPPGDTLIHKGDNLNSIYFIARGTLEIISNNQAMAILDKNDIFGENIGKYQERDVMGRSSCDVRALAYCDLHKIDRCDLLDVLEMYPDFAESFEKKFQVTFDLRECELNESRPRKKKSNRTIRNLLLAANKNSQIGRNSSFNTTNSNLALICENEAKTNQNLDNLAPIYRKSINSILNFNSSLSASLNAPNDANLLQISPTRKITGSFQRRNKLRSTSRLSPMVFSSELNSKRNSCISNNSLPKKKVVSSYADVETEIQSLLEKVSKTEQSIKIQMDMLTNFVLNHVINDTNWQMSNSNKFA